MERFTPAFSRLFDADHELAGEPVCRRFAWLDICHMAQHTGGTKVIRGKPLKLQRGDVLISVRWLGERWSWSRSKVQRFLELLTDPAVNKLGTRFETLDGTVYRVVSYERYRDVWDSHRDTNRTADEPPTSHKLDSKVSPTRAREDGDVVENSPASSAPSALDGTGVRQEAIAIVRALDGFDSISEQGVVAQYRWWPNDDGTLGTRAAVWSGLPPDRIPEVFSTALTRTAAEIRPRRWHSRFFDKVLRSCIEDELSPSPAEQAKAKSATTPAGRLNAGEESRRESNRQAQARSRQATADGERIRSERLAEQEREQKALEWLSDQAVEIQQEIEASARRGLRALGFPDPPKVMLKGYVIQECVRRGALPADVDEAVKS